MSTRRNSARAALAAAILFGCGSQPGAGSGSLLPASAPATTPTAAADQNIAGSAGSAAPAVRSGDPSSATAAAGAMNAAATLSPDAGAALAGAGGTAAPMSSVAPAPTGPSGLVTDPQTGELVFRTDSIKLAAGQESYVCFAATLEQDETIDGFKKGAQTFVHHIQFVRTLAPEPEGQSQCDVLFKITWMPIFLAGAGASELRLDEGVGHSLPAGTQLMAQFHLLNATSKDIDQQIEIRMHRSDAPNPTPVNPWAIGSSEINLAPQQAGRAQNVCTVNGQVDLVAVFPHMHMLGTRLTVEAGKSADALSMLYQRDPYSFDDQHMENSKISLQDGDVVRVTCDYLNTTDKVVQFGESTHDEMCFFIGFAIGDPPLADCGNLWDPVFATLQQ